MSITSSRIAYDERYKLFNLYPGESLYAFCITPELYLEHIYWGKQLQRGYDLRYLTQSSRMRPFDTAEQFDANNYTSFQAVKKSNDLSAFMRLSASIRSKADEEDMKHFDRARYQNFKWRTTSMKRLPCESTIDEEDPEPSQRASTVSMNDVRLFNESSSSDNLMSSRNRSDSSPPVQCGIIAGVLSNEYRPSFVEPFVVIDETTAGEVILATKSPKFDRKGGELGKGTLCMEYSDVGTGDFRSPSFVVASASGSCISPLRYKSHVIIPGKLPMPNSMPSIRAEDVEEATTLVITMFDEHSGLDIDLIYVCLHQFDAITRRAVFRNKMLLPKVIQRAFSVTVDFEATTSAFHLTQLSGSWARERQIVETKLNIGVQSIGSVRGVSSHQHNPFAVITLGPPSEDEGETKGFSLVYSGNFIFEAELSEMGRLRLNMGIHPMGFAWHLDAGASFSTPEALMVRSPDGLGGLSRLMHRIILDKFVPKNWSDSIPPIVFNSWEAMYFDVEHTAVVDMAFEATKIGANLIVLDDGWFGVRDDINSSLGDWTPHKSKFPLGLRQLTDEINSFGLKFGIWIEPEMVSENSKLYSLHPDWCLQIPGRSRQIGRNQLVLDLSRRRVRDYIFATLSKLLSSGNIEYVKWDMNRPLTEVFSQLEGSTEVWQAEISHRYVLGIYDLLTRLRLKFPDILFEHCASGGGRFDLGMLYFGSQIWCSDNTDAIARMKIQYGTSLAYPARCIGAHITGVPNHITGNTTRSKTRALVAMCGTFGYELNLANATMKETFLFREYSEVYLTVASIIRYGDLYRLWNPFKVTYASWMYVSRDKKEAVVFAFSLNSDHWSNLVPRLQLKGLLPDGVYEVREPLPNNLIQQSGNLRIVEAEFATYQLGYSSIFLTGDILMKAGMPVKFYTLDDSVMFILKAIR